MKTKPAFTLYECLIALMIISLVLLLMNQVLSGYRKLDKKMTFQTTQNFQLSLIQLEHQLADYECIKIEPSRVVFQSKIPDSKKADFYPKAILKLSTSNSLNLSINNGNQPILKNVVAIRFSEDQGFAQMKVIFVEGTEKDAHILLPPKKAD